VRVTSNQIFHFSLDGTPSTSRHSRERFICRECASYRNSAEAGTALPSVGPDDFRVQLCMNLVVTLADLCGSECGRVEGGGVGVAVVTKLEDSHVMGCDEILLDEYFPTF
jgi:hypothetical protein